MLVRCLAEELTGHNITINELIPGPVLTDMNSNWGEQVDPIFLSGPEWVKSPEDLVPMLLFLLTQPDKGPTGQSFSMNRREI